MSRYQMFRVRINSQIEIENDTNESRTLQNVDMFFSKRNWFQIVGGITFYDFIWAYRTFHLHFSSVYI